MNDSIGKISFLQLGMIILLTNGLLSHVIINPMILDVSGRDSWLVPLFMVAALIPWCLILFVIMKKTGQQKLQPWLSKRIGPFLSWVLVLPVYLQIYMIGASTTIHTGAWTIANYLPATPQTVLIGVLLIVCCYSAVSGIRAIAIGAGVLLPFVVALGYFVMSSNMPNKEFNLLKPVMEHGWGPVMHGMIYAGGCFMELVLLITLQHHLKKKIKIWQLFVLVLILIHTMTGPLVGAITEFGPHEAAKQMESPYEQWRLVKIGDFIEHVDFFSVFQWLSGAAVRIGLSLFLLVDLLPIHKPRTRKWFILIIGFSYLLLSMLPISRETYYLWFRVYFQLTLILILCVTLLWMCISIFAKPVKERTI